LALEQSNKLNKELTQKKGIKLDQTVTSSIYSQSSLAPSSNHQDDNASSAYQSSR